MSCQIRGLSSIAALTFSINSPGNCMIMYLNQLPSVGSAFTNCFKRPSFISRVGDIIFFLSTSGTCRMLGSPGLESANSSQSSSSLKLYYPTYREYFVYPHWWARRKHTILRSIQMIQLCLSYCNNSMTIFTSPCSSRRQTECPIGPNKPNKLPLCRRTHFNFRFQLSINICHLFGL